MAPKTTRGTATSPMRKSDPRKASRSASSSGTKPNRWPPGSLTAIAALPCRLPRSRSSATTAPTRACCPMIAGRSACRTPATMKVAAANGALRPFAARPWSVAARRTAARFQPLDTPPVIRPPSPIGTEIAVPCPVPRTARLWKAKSPGSGRWAGLRRSCGHHAAAFSGEFAIATACRPAWSTDPASRARCRARGCCWLA